MLTPPSVRSSREAMTDAANFRAVPGVAPRAKTGVCKKRRAKKLNGMAMPFKINLCLNLNGFHNFASSIFLKKMMTRGRLDHKNDFFL